MKFRCERDVITREVMIAQEIVSSRNVMSILSNVLIEAHDDSLTIKATDLKVAFETSIKVEVVAAGSATVYCDKLLGILRSLPAGEVEVELDANAMLLIRPLNKKIDFKLRSVASEKYPEIQSMGDARYFEFAQADLNTMIANTIFAVSDDETRYFMNGVFIEKAGDKLTMVASDGRRLSYISKPIDPAVEDIKGVIVPPKILSMLRKLLPGEGNLSVCVTERNVFVRFGERRLSSSLIDGQFPNYRRVIPESQQYTATVQKSELENALKRVSLLVEQKSRRVFLTLQPGAIIVASEESEIGAAREEVVCEYSGPEATIALNYMYLLEPLREIDTDTVSIQHTDTNKAVTLTSVPEKDYVHIVMPMQAR
jgi:DNA polymerase III subunit beta